jgi:hypothetical protein
MILFLKPYAFKSWIRFLTNTCLILLVASNKPRVTCFGFQSNPKNFMTKTNTSCAPLDIHKSKLVVAQLQSFNISKTYVSLIFSTNSNKTVFENHFQEWNCIWGHNYNTKHFNNTLSTNCKGKWLFTIKSPRFSTNIFCSTSSFLKGIFEAKNSNMEKLEIRGLFFANWLSTFFFPLIINFFLKPFTNY